jgi:VIT1/CCC1 family predicted Fe2+/Mn2+ transporter
MHQFSRRDDPYRAEIRRHEARRKLAEQLGGIYVEDFVFGANDGIITTFAVVSGAIGGNLGSTVIEILGFANLFADGVSMGASNYLGKRSKRDYISSQRRMEEWEVEHLPAQETQEIKQILIRMGLEGEQLDNLVEAITRNKTAWVNLMMSEELGLSEDTDSPLRHGTATLGAFVVAGSVPLVPYMFCSGTLCFIISAILTGVALFAAGALRTLITGVNWLRGGLEMLGVGSAAAFVAYAVGRVIASLV